MIYSTLKFLAQLTVKGYFRSVLVKGRENIPRTGPVLFAPNHPSAFMDPILLGSTINRKLYFLARGDIFKQRFASMLFSLVNMIPVFRKQDAPGHSEKNDMVFQKCFDHLARRKPIMIFPEGLSKTERRLRPIKTGTARIALGAEAQHDFNLGVTIVPVGINYSNPHNFQSDVFVNFGKPIPVSEYKEKYANDEWSTVEELTERLKSSLEELLVIVEDEQFDSLIQRIERLYLHQLRENSNPSEKLLEDFHLSKDVVSAVNFHYRKDPRRLLAFESQLNGYMENLKDLKVRDTQVRAKSIQLNFFGLFLYFLLGSPLFMYGYATNFPAYWLAGKLAEAIPLRDDFVGSIRLAAGMLVFLIIYLCQAAVVGYFFGLVWAIIFILSLYPAGLFTLGYIKKYYRLAGSLRYLRLFMTKSDRIARLKVARESLISELEAGKEEYLAHINNVLN